MPGSMPKPTCAIGAAGLVLLLCGVNAVAARPDFSGDWKMNPSRSSFAPLPAPDSMARKITHHDPQLKIVTTQTGQGHDSVTELSYTTDGKECKNTIRGQEVTGTARWDGDKLVIASKRQSQGMEINQTETW